MPRMARSETSRAAMGLKTSESAAYEVYMLDYESEILEHLQKMEFRNGSKLPVDPVMIDSQPELEWYMRPYLIDFLLEMHAYFRLRPETLFLACSIVDRYLSKRMVRRAHYQLTVTTAMWIAAKYEDKKSRKPLLKELVQLCRDCYEAKMFVQMEMHILSTLNWEIGSVTSMYDCLMLFLDMDCLKYDQAASSITGLATFLLENSMYERDYMYYSSAIRALSAALVASKMLENSAIAEQIQSAALASKNSLNQKPKSFYGHTSRARKPNALDALQLTAETLEDIRKCSLQFINDTFKTRTIGKNFPAALLQKYNSFSFEPIFESYWFQHISVYGTLCQLTRNYNATSHGFLDHTLEGLIDRLIGLLPIGQGWTSHLDTYNSAYWSNGSMAYKTDCRNMSDQAVSPSNSHSFSASSIAQPSDSDLMTPHTPLSSSGSVFSGNFSSLSQSSADSPMFVQSSKPPMARWSTCSSGYNQNNSRRVSTRLNSVESSMME
ncbi:LAME_0G02102g1_1 [Lachancea meyersii CBS 8951]|uniref:LAME_0G02102g1_1 n=1 Tax=Lachancea meyersii CBS 8951 TaxID=1266667 RepID=A0A1G4K5R2_9SACH|nr:LAME_0G02102g1_1 [Lachancea meyersii CBS 8951]